MSSLAHPVLETISVIPYPTGSICGVSHHGTPKPSIQSKYILKALELMEEHHRVRWNDWTQQDHERWDDREQRDQDQWEKMEQSIDLLFAKMGEIDKTQQQVSTQLDLSTQVMEQMLKDQVLLAQQMEHTGREVAQLSLNQTKPHQESRPQQTRFTLKVRCIRIHL
jgi:hypothetical protein